MRGNPQTHYRHLFAFEQSQTRNPHVLLHEGLWSAGRRRAIVRHAGENLVKTIVLIDDDPGVLFWLGRILFEAGFNPIPAKSCRHAAKLLRECTVSVDLLVLNTALPGSAGFTSAFRRNSPHSKIIALMEESGESPSLGAADRLYRKPRPDELKAAAQELAATAEWLRIVAGVFAERVQ